ncbi:glutathione-disulfide reductase [Comamonas sp. NLF-1-9]|uniref:glutathione-disulfide reductase n=1 Tax=Comamonas sp. NLF-1-9 TaxID=2853163 RepID=UPI001C46A0F8|nr:glutathione-disulfide reductase [Comamonas sp. NLF-1-9]QXL83918.1 glutathione-disulfide reductase [Comamonas sp. NLF-1-9]
MAGFDFDLFVVGGGSGGVRAARFAGQRGVRVALAESGRMGGTCVNVGCIPKKLYSYAAEYAEGFADARGYGWILPGEPVLDWALLKANRARSIGQLNAIYDNLMTSAGVERMHGHARLVDAHTVQVQHADGRVTHHSAATILLATGGAPWVPELPGRELVVTSNEIFDLPRFPRRLAVVGGGYIASEFASIFRGMGSEVVQLYRGEQILRGFDDEVRNFAAQEMGKAGVDIRCHADVVRVEAAGEGRRLILKDGSALEADVALYATGRRAATADLGLEALGVRLAANGAIEVDARFATSVPGIYAVGDVVGRKELTPVALAEAMALVDQLFGPAPGKAARVMNYDNIATAIFTHPPIGTVGLSEAQARERCARVRIYRSDFRPLQHSLSGRSERTLVKLVVDDASDRVLGAHIVGADASEIIQGFAVALQCGATKAQFDATLGIHPTSAEEFVTLRELTRT